MVNKKGHRYTMHIYGLVYDDAKASE